MKLRDFEKKASDELITDKEKYIVELLKERKKEINKCELTLRQLKKNYNNLLEKDLDDIDEEDDEFDY